MVREVCLAKNEKPWDAALQVVVNPQPTHGVMNRGKDTHGLGVRILTRDAVVHLEQVAVAGLDNVPSKAGDVITEVEVHRQARVARPSAIVANFLGVS